MFYFLSKTVFIIAMPISWVIMLLIAALWTNNPRRKRLYIIAAICVLWIGGNRWVTNSLLSWWERPAVPISAIAQPYEVGIVLGGVVNSTRPETDRVHIEAAADRLMHAVQLYREGKIRRIMLVGSADGLFYSGRQSEAQSLRDILRLCQVPDSVVILEERSRNTRENALFSKPILDIEAPGHRCLLITSAFHMRRAEGCFAKAGVPIDPYPVDFQTKRYPLNAYFFPNEDAFRKFYTFTHEVVGYITYRIVGYV